MVQREERDVSSVVTDPSVLQVSTLLLLPLLLLLLLLLLLDRS